MAQHLSWTSPSPEERALYDQWGKVWTDYKKGTEQVLELSRKAVETHVATPLGMSLDEAAAAIVTLPGAIKRG